MQLCEITFVIVQLDANELIISESMQATTQAAAYLASPSQASVSSFLLGAWDMRKCLHSLVFTYCKNCISDHHYFSMISM